MGESGVMLCTVCPYPCALFFNKIASQPYVLIPVLFFKISPGAIHVLQAFSSLSHHDEGMLQLVTNRLTQLAETTSVQATPAAAYSHQHTKNAEHNQQVQASLICADVWIMHASLVRVLEVRRRQER